MCTPKFTFLYITIFFSSFLIHSVSAELCHPDDKRVLLSIKKFYNNQYDLSSWTNDTDCCRWYIVKCDRTTHRITTFNLITNGISGEIPALIGDLPYLETLIFRKLPNITGSIPEAIAKLKNLSMVRLSWTNLSGPVPSFFSQLPNLNYLDLSYNRLSGSIPPSLSQLPNLGTLHLDRNQLTSSIPKSFGSFKQSNFYLILSHNRLSGPIPKTLGRANFTNLDLSRNQLTGDASFLFGKDKELQFVDLSRNMFEFDISKVEFGSSLNNIDLNHNKLYGSIPSSLADLPQLQFLNVSYNRLCGSIPTGGRLSQFDQDCYFHNRCLCGSPLPPCN